MTQETIQAPGADLSVGPHRVETVLSPRWVRVQFNGEFIADSKRALLLRESKHLPVYYFPPEDVRMDLLTPTDNHTRCPYKGDASYWTITVGDRSSENAVWGYMDPLPGREDIKGYLAFYWTRVDHWFEEETEIFKHARDPYKRVDAIPSSRHVQVVIDGQTVADTRRPTLVFETNHPVRYYIPREDIRLDLLESTETQSTCPYKGDAVYWRPKIGDTSRDIAWSYPEPIAECPKIKGLISFFNERVDSIEVDGEVTERPQTSWS